MVALLERVRDRAGELLKLAEILPGAEPLPRAGEHDAADRRVGCDIERVSELGLQRARERVEDVGPVQGDREDGAVALVSTSSAIGRSLSRDRPGAS